MSLAEADDPFAVDVDGADSGAGEGGSPTPSGDAGDSSSPAAGPMDDKWFGLRNTDPPITPAEVGSQLDLDAEWYQHLGAGFIKQTGSGGAEAWMHYVMAVALLFMSLFGDPGEGSTEPTGDVEQFEGADPGAVNVEGGDWLE